ncbi:MAG: ABC-2 family transporter protein [Lentisphaerae bacterium ADurb.Bin242]|nr:MAG: ABC-2 family transporter protein [Lentisphaerae bacterium ADurb.Bin242]
MDFLKIGRFELRRQQMNLCIALPAILVFAGLVYGGFFPYTWKDNLAGIFLIVVPLGVLFLSLDVFTRDFQQGTAPILFTLPVKQWKVYLAKYLFSLFLFLLIVFLVYAITLLSCDDNSLPKIIGRLNQSRETNVAFAAVFYPLLPFTMILLYLHASITMWCIAFRGTGGIAAAFFLIPGVLFLLLPSFIWFTRDYSAAFYESIPQILMYVVIFVFIGGIFWCRGIGLGRPMWILALKSLGILFAASLLSFVVFYGIQITEYMTTLAKFEKTPGIEIPMGKLSVIHAIWEGKVPKSADDVLNTDLKTMIEIPVEDYGKYYDRELAFVGNSNHFINEAVKAKNFDKALRLLDAYESIPEYVIPKVTWQTRIHTVSEPTGKPGKIVQRKKKEFIAFSDPYTPGYFIQYKYLLGTPSSGKEKQPYSYLALPFEKDTLPMIDAMIARLEKKPVWKDTPVKILPLGEKSLYSSDGKRFSTDRALRDILPGLDKQGFERFRAAAAFVFKPCQQYESLWFLMSGGRLAPAITSMKAWMWSARLRADIAKDATCHEIPRFPDPAQNSSVIYDDYMMHQKYQNGILRKYLWLPRLKLRKYALEHGTLPEKLSDAFPENEIIHTAGDKIYKLEYCVNPKQEDSYPPRSINCHDYTGTRRHPHLHLTERQYKEGKQFFYSPFFEKCELDEPEPPLPEKRGAK